MTQQSAPASIYQTETEANSTREHKSKMYKHLSLLFVVVFLLPPSFVPPVIFITLSVNPTTGGDAPVKPMVTGIILIRMSVTLVVIESETLTSLHSQSTQQTASVCNQKGRATQKKAPRKLASVACKRSWLVLPQFRQIREKENIKRVTRISSAVCDAARLQNSLQKGPGPNKTKKDTTRKSQKSHTTNHNCRITFLRLSGGHFVSAREENSLAWNRDAFLIQFLTWHTRLNKFWGRVPCVIKIPTFIKGGLQCNISIWPQRQ